MRSSTWFYFPPTARSQGLRGGVEFRSRLGADKSLFRSLVQMLVLVGITLQAWAVQREVMTLPAGFGWAESRRTTVLECGLEFEKTVDTTWKSTNAAAIYVMEESKPVLFKVAHVLWDEVTHDFSFVAADAMGDRAVWLDDLQAAKNDLVDVSMVTKRSNDHYFAATAGAGEMTVEEDVDGTAHLSGTITLAPGTFQTHFPYDVRITTAANGQVSVSKDSIVTGTSHLGDVADLTLAYARTCNECRPGQPPASEEMGTQGVRPAGGVLTVLPDGGLFANVSVPVAMPLMWGGEQGASAHVIVQSFAAGIFEVAGDWLAGSLGGEDSEGPGRLLLAGWGVINGTQTFSAERPGSVGYRSGNAAYPGVNYKCETGGPFTAISKLTDAFHGPYTLAADSKYIVRYSGVTGRHNGAAMAAGGSSVELYGFSTTLTEFGMTFVENANNHGFAAPVSRVRGTISIGGPCDLDVPFQRLVFNCTGDIVELVPGSSFVDPRLAYWELPFEPVALRFPIGDSCGGTGRVPLAILMKVHAAHLADPLFGEVGIWPDGQLVTKWDETGPNPDASKRDTRGIVSRFPLPTKLKLDGPGSEKFNFIPCEDAYLNTEEIANGQKPGFFNLAGLMDVPFFQDMMVHVHLSSRAALNPSIHVMGGFPAHGFRDAQGGHYFNRDFFDERHKGYAGNTVANYRNGSVENYQPRAKQSWMGMATFDHPVQWNPARRVFGSTASHTQSLFVFDAESDIPIITPRSTEIHFGASYSGLPRISLANLAFNAIDDAHGLVQAFENSALGGFREHLQSGLDHVATLVADDAEQLIGPAITRAMTAGNLQWPPQNGDANAAALNVMLNIPGAGNPNASLGAGAKLLLNAFGLENPASPPAVLAEMDSALGEIEAVLDEFAGAGAVLDNAYGMQQLLGNLMTAVPGGAALSNNELAAIWSKAQPNLDALKRSALEIKSRIHELRGELDGGMIELNLEGVTGPLEAELKSAIGQARQAVEEEIADTMAQHHGFSDRSHDEWQTMLRGELIRSIGGNVTLKRGLQQLARNHLMVAESALRETIDQWFQALNQTLREAAAQTLGGIDQRLQSYLGNRIGGGQFDGYAHINGDTLREMRVNAGLEFRVPEAMSFKGYLLIKDLQACGPKGCYGTADSAWLIELGAEDVPLKFGEFGLRADLAAKFVLINSQPAGFGGSFELRGRMDFQTFQINALKAAVMVTASTGDNYVSGFADVQIQSYGLAGGIFLGRACSVEPIAMWDPFVAEFLGDKRTFTGVYAYGEGRMPIVDYGCAFNIVAGVGLGAFFFTEGPEVGGRAHMEIKGEALCTLTIKGDIDLVGSASGDRGLRMEGRGKLKGKVGWCPCCVKFRKKVTISYANGDYSADY